MPGTAGRTRCKLGAGWVAPVRDGPARAAAPCRAGAGPCMIGSSFGRRIAMTSIVTGHRSFRHELCLYRSAENLLEFVVPLARDGVAREEPTLLLLRADAA